jgi:dTDP-4-dehydrorhamnose reductase
VLLLGGSGQVGHELRRLLAPRCTLQPPKREQLDLADAAALREAVRASRAHVIFSAAGYTGVDDAERDVAAAAALNADAPAVLAEEAARTGALLVHYSTDYVFDGRERRPYREDDATAPLSAYGRTKLAGEHAIRQSGCRHLVLRTSWVYGPRRSNFVLTMLKLAAQRPELQVVADQRGAPTSARSLADATMRIVDQLAGKPARDVYHLAGEGEASWHEFATAIVGGGAQRGLCPEVPIKAIPTASRPTPARRPAYSVLDSGRAQADFGVRLPPWQLDLQRCLDDLVTH